MNLKLILVLSISHVFIDLTGMAIPAILPFLKNTLALTYTQVGAVIMVSNLTSSIIQPGFGYLSDRIAMKWLLPVSVMLTYVGFSFTGLAPTYPFLLLLVVINGMGIACYHPESFKMMHYFTGSRKATGMSFFQVGGNLGLALGPLLLTYAVEIADLSGTLLFLILGVLLLALILVYYKELTLPVKSEKSATPVAGKAERPAEDKSDWISVLLLLFAVTMRSCAHTGLVTYIPFYYINTLQGDTITAARLVFAFLFGGVAGTVLGGIIADKIGYKYFFCLSMLLTVPLLFLFIHATGIWVFVLVFLVGLVLVSSFSVTIVMGQMMLQNRLGMASGLMLGFVIGVGGVGAGLLGLVADGWGINAVLTLLAIMPAVGLVPALILKDPSKQTMKLRPAR
ncbi:MAG: sugar phosphate permease [Deltaproteobacteria bacterium]|nr:sugar phosphate permease [Deltaproteobacteria bacterium]